MRKLVRWLTWGVFGLVALIVVVAAGGYWWLLQALPRVDGEIIVDGLDAPVTMVRDEHGIPHIEARRFEDALFAQGFAHAQDRLWQMEFQRRLGAGRLAEVVGEGAVNIDRFMRLLGLYDLAEIGQQHLSAESRAWLDAYAAGVNAFLEQRSGPLPPEFLILGHSDIEPWRPADSIVWIKMMALDLSLNWRRELLRARLANQLSREQIADLWPTYPDDAPITLAALTRDLDLEALASVLPPGPEPGIGSNAWVVSGEFSKSGAPLLANDPHLGLRSPGTWYLAHLKAPDLELIGAGLPGVPGLVLGHNGEIAWGMTNTGPDSQDLFIEKIDPDDPGRYLTPDGSKAFSTRVEVINIKDGEPVTFTARTTRHGPVISDLVGNAAETLDDGQVLAFAWTALAEDDTSIETLFRMTEARDWQSFLEAGRGHGAPQQNVFYADRKGHIGFMAPGRVPIRKKGDGLWPVPGWSGDYDWIGMLDFDDLPRAFDPAEGRLLNGNNRIVPDDYPHFITAIWEPPYRATRIEALLDGRMHDIESFAGIQLDQFSLLADDLLPFMLDMTPSSVQGAKAADELRSWDRVMDAEKAEPLIFVAWYRAFTRLAYADELGPLFYAYWNLRPQFVERILKKTPIWCDDQTTGRIETCADILSTALDLALADLEERYGADRTTWRWGEPHQARMKHEILDGIPLLERVFTIGEPTGGDGVSVNVGHFALQDGRRPFTSIQAATYRGLYDLENLDRSRFVSATGQSGNPLSRHYRDLSRLWARGETIPMERRPELYGRHAEGRLTLRP